MISHFVYQMLSFLITKWQLHNTSYREGECCSKPEEGRECKITLETTLKEEMRWRERVGGKWEMERGYPGGCSRNLSRYFLLQTQTLRNCTVQTSRYTHTHTYNPTFYVKNTQQWSTAQLWFKAFFDWVGLRPTPDFLCGTVCRLQLYEHAHAHTYTSLMRHSVPPRAPYFVSLFSSLQVIQYLVPAPHTFWSMSRHSQFYHTYACMRSHKYVHTYANTDTHTHHVPLLSFYTSCSPPNLFT